MTLAEQWREKIRCEVDFASSVVYLTYLKRHDPSCSVKDTDVGIVIIFSDGSMHRMGVIPMKTTNLDK